MGVESIKDIYQYPTVRTWRRHSRTPCSMLTRGDLAKRAEVVDVESGKLPAPKCSWMLALRLRRPLPGLIRTTLPRACLTWFGRNTDLCVSSRAFDQDRYRMRLRVSPRFKPFPKTKNDCYAEHNDDYPGV
jgi:hypothetical protein